MDNNTEKAELPLKIYLNGLTKKKQLKFKQFVIERLGKKSRTTIFNWVNGKHQPSQSEKERIAQYFKVDVATIF